MFDTVPEVLFNSVYIDMMIESLSDILGELMFKRFRKCHNYFLRKYNVTPENYYKYVEHEFIFEKYPYDHNEISRINDFTELLRGINVMFREMQLQVVTEGELYHTSLNFIREAMKSRYHLVRGEPYHIYDLVTKLTHKAIRRCIAMKFVGVIDNLFDRSLTTTYFDKVDQIRRSLPHHERTPAYMGGIEENAQNLHTYSKPEPNAPTSPPTPPPLPPSQPRWGEKEKKKISLFADAESASDDDTNDAP